MIRLPAPFLALSLLVGGASLPAWADEKAPPPSNAPSPAEKTPLPTTTQPDPSKSEGGTPAPAPEQAPVRQTPPGAPPPSAAGPSPRQTLVPPSAESNDVETVTLAAKPAAIVSGTTKWEEAVPSLKASFARIEAALAKAGVKATGRPIAIFMKTEDAGFDYEAMIPIEAMPANPPTEEGLRFGTTPAGKAMRFPHKGSYDEIDGTYETLTAYLDAKDIAVQDRFVEEYVTDLTDKADEKLDVNIYALTK